MSFNLKGSIVAIITPFLENKEIDWEAFDRIIDIHLNNKTDGLVVCGTTGETPTLSDEEDEALIARAIEKVNGKIPVIAGSGSNSTQTTIEKTQKAKELGADAVLVVVPYYNKPTQKGIYEHFKTLTEAVDIPIILYNVPSRTGAGLTPETVLQLANDFDNIVALKEAAGILSNFTEVISKAPKEFLVYSGDDYLSTSANLLGADGCISVLANIIPADFHDLMIASMSGDLKTTHQLFYKYQKLMSLLFIESNPIPVKAALAYMGHIKEFYRAPLCVMDNDNKAILIKALKEQGF